MKVNPAILINTEIYTKQIHLAINLINSIFTTKKCLCSNIQGLPETYQFISQAFKLLQVIILFFLLLRLLEANLAY